MVIPACTIVASIAKEGTAPSEGGDHRSAANVKRDLGNDLVTGKRALLTLRINSSWRLALNGLLKALRARPGDVAVAVSVMCVCVCVCVCV